MVNIDSFVVGSSNSVHSNCFVVFSSISSSDLLSCSAFLHPTNSSNYLLFHRRLGYFSDKILFQVLKTYNKLVSFNKLTSFYEACQYNKNYQITFLSSVSKSATPLELLHTNLWGPFVVPFKEGYQYYIQFLDDFSCLVWIYPIKVKLEALDIFIKFQTIVERQFDKKKNQGGSIKLGRLVIIFRHSCSYIHYQNGKLERKDKYIVELGLG